MLTLIIFILVLGLLVLVHELGHFFVARRNGVKVEEFGIGFPPKIFSIKRGDTIYSLNLLPLGGFVKIKGEMGENAEDEDSFGHKTIWQRTKIVSAGVIMNYVLAAVLLIAGFIVGIPQSIEGNESKLANIKEAEIQVAEVIDNSPAKTAGVEIGDTIFELDGQKLETIEAVEKYTNGKTGQEMSVKLQRNGNIVDFKITPKVLEGETRGEMGVGIVKVGIVSYPWYYAVWKGIETTGILTWKILQAFYSLFKNILLHGKLGIDITGPVGIAIVTGKVARMGLIYLLQFIALLSINLAIINFLPFPALDGGRVMFFALEKLRGKAISQKIENAIHTAGFALLMLLIIVVTYRDIATYGGKFIGKIKGWF